MYANGPDAVLHQTVALHTHPRHDYILLEHTRINADENEWYSEKRCVAQGMFPVGGNREWRYYAGNVVYLPKQRQFNFDLNTSFIDGSNRQPLCASKDHIFKDKEKKNA